jgi:hypothetical protein
LYPKEADISLAARSFHSVVLTFDKKKGPLKDAYDQGGTVVFLTDFDKSGMSLRDFIKRAWSPSSAPGLAHKKKTGPDDCRSRQ